MTGSPASRSGADGRSASVVLLLLVLAWGTASCVSVSRQEEIEIGRDYARQLNDELPLVRDGAVRGPVSDLGHALARVSARPDLPYEFQVVNTNVVNAFAVPGGFIYMNRGLIADATEMSQVAGVMAHEVAHVVARHSAEQIERARAARLGLAGLSVLVGRPEGAARAGVAVAGNLYFARHSREAEAEADSLAVHMMVDAGWHPSGLVEFFRILMKNRQRKPGALEALFTSHPLTEDRIESVQTLIGTLPGGTVDELRHTSPGFDELKAALEKLPPPPEKYRVEEKPDGGEGS